MFKLPIAKEGYPYIIGSFALALFAVLVGWGNLATLLFGLAIFVTCFFRDPERAIQVLGDEILSPADGKVLSVDTVTEGPYVTGPTQRVCIFMSVFNAHVNRVPVGGSVKRIQYQAGRFLMAFDEKTSLENEQNAVWLEDKQGRGLVMVQIAGLIARRIVCYLEEGQSIEAGERFGLIRFGSRMDIYLPLSAKVQVAPGDKVKAGLNVIAVW